MSQPACTSTGLQGATSRLICSRWEATARTHLRHAQVMELWIQAPAIRHVLAGCGAAGAAAAAAAAEAKRLAEALLSMAHAGLALFATESDDDGRGIVCTALKPVKPEATPEDDIHMYIGVSCLELHACSHLHGTCIWPGGGNAG
jgi:hypothetical protein